VLLQSGGRGRRAAADPAGHHAGINTQEEDNSTDPQQAVLSTDARQSIGDRIPGGSARGGLCRHPCLMEVRDGRPARESDMTLHHVPRLPALLCRRFFKSLLKVCLTGIFSVSAANGGLIRGNITNCR
jgi:hypothetical protein